MEDDPVARLDSVVVQVEATALSALTQLADGEPGTADLQLLSWAARLHRWGILPDRAALHGVFAPRRPKQGP